MSKMEKLERAGAAGTATGSEVAKAESLTAPFSPDEALTPDNTPPSDAVGTDGADVLDRIHAYLDRFICYPSPEASIVHVLWIAHTHLMDEWFSTPRLAILSAEPGSGKSRVLELTGLFVPNPLLSVNASPAYILRKISDQGDRPTVLYDEIDAIFGPAARGNEELRGMINAGYRPGMKVGRCFMDKGKVLTEELDTYAAVAMSGLGNLPDTIMSRSVIIRMRKRGPDEKAEPFRPRLHEPLADPLFQELLLWAASVAHLARAAQPRLPDGIADRNADVWGPLLIVADLAGGRWPDLARDAAIKAVRAMKANERPTLGVQLLADIRICFGEADRLTTKDLLDRLLADDEAPWGDLGGKKIDARKLAQMLRPYGIKSSTVRMRDDSTPKGYKREDFHDVWNRYLPASELAATSATCATEMRKPWETGVSSVADKSALSPCGGKGEEAES